MPKFITVEVDDGRYRESIIRELISVADTFDHIEAVNTIKSLGRLEAFVKKHVEETFFERSRDCMHRHTRPDSPAFFCDKRRDEPCSYSQCPYVKGEAI